MTVYSKIAIYIRNMEEGEKLIEKTNKRRLGRGYWVC